MIDVPALKRLWVHEALRVYHDRLIDDDDRKWMYETLQEICTRDLKEDFHQLLIRLDSNKDGIVSSTDRNLQLGLYF